MRVSTSLAGTFLTCWILMQSAAANEPSASLPLPAEEALTTVVYDVLGLGPSSDNRTLEIAVMPFLDEDVAEEHNDQGSLEDALLSILVDHMHSDEFQYEGREIEMLDGGRLLVTAPAEVHAAVAGLIDYIDAASSRRAVLRWDVFEVTGDSAPEGKLATAMIDTLVQQGNAVLVQSRRESVPLGRTVRRVSERTHQVLTKWEPEIAQQAIAEIPGLNNLISGMTLLLRVEDIPGGGAQRVRMLQRIVGAPKLVSHNIDPNDLVIMELASVELSTHMIIELHRAEATTISGSGLLRPGEELVASAWCRTSAGVTGRITRLVLEHVDPAPRPLQLAGMETRLLDLSAFFWRGMRMPRAHAWRLQGREGHAGSVSYRDFDVGRVTFPTEEYHWDDTLEAAVEPFQWADGGVWEEGNWMLLSGSPESLATALITMSSRRLVKRSVKLEWGIVDGSGDALAGGCFDLEQGDEALALVGDSFSYLHGLESDVATGAMGTRTRVAEAFDGLWLVAHADGRGGVQLVLARNHLSGLDEISLGRGSGTFHRAVFESSDLQIRFRADGKRHELAELSPGPGNAKLWARATVH